jgi:hypothetical protein
MKVTVSPSLMTVWSSALLATPRRLLIVKSTDRWRGLHNTNPLEFMTCFISSSLELL